MGRHSLAVGVFVFKASQATPEACGNTNAGSASHALGLTTIATVSYRSSALQRPGDVLIAAVLTTAYQLSETRMMALGGRDTGA